MLTMGDTVLVAVSGGPDSVALLYLLKQAMPLYHLDLHVFHLNHQLRGREADEDAQFVKEFAELLGIPVILESFDVPALMKREKLSLEEAAREARYRLMNQIAASIKADRIALGHQADDQIETFLMRLIRGAGLEGLQSIPPVRDHYIRPLIEVTREDVLQYIDDNRLTYRLDASNEDLSILRNRIRYELVPLLIGYNPQFKGTLHKTIELVRDDQSHLEEITDGVFEALADTGTGIVRIPIQGLLAQSIAIRRRLVRRCIKWVKSNLRGIEFKHIEAVLEGLGSVPVRVELELPGQIIVFAEYDDLVFGQRSLFEPPVFEPIVLSVPGITTINPLDVEIEAEFVERGDLVFERDGEVAHIDAGKLTGVLMVRTRRPGDSFRPFGMAGEKKLQDFFTDEKVPRRQRNKIPIVESDGKIVWIAGFRIDDSFKVTEETERVLVLRMR